MENFSRHSLLIFVRFAIQTNRSRVRNGVTSEVLTNEGF